MATPVLFDDNNDMDSPLWYAPPNDFDDDEWEWNEEDEEPEDWLEENDMDYIFDAEDDPDGWGIVDHYLEEGEDESN